MRKFILILVFVFVCVAFFGCTNKEGSNGKVYGKEDTNISVNVGEIFTLKLDENLTTGYQWSYVINDENVIVLSEDEYVQESTDENIAGAGGQRQLTFEAKSKGNTVISMVYEQSWEKHEDDEKLTFNIEVK